MNIARRRFRQLAEILVAGAARAYGTSCYSRCAKRTNILRERLRAVLSALLTIAHVS